MTVLEGKIPPELQDWPINQRDNSAGNTITPFVGQSLPVLMWYYKPALATFLPHFLSEVRL